MNYAYEGPGPHQDPIAGLVRPGDVRNFDEAPDWGPWRPLSEVIRAASVAVMTPGDVAALERAEAASAPSPTPTPPAIGLSALTTPPAGTEGM